MLRSLLTNPEDPPFLGAKAVFFDRLHVVDVSRRFLGSTILLELGCPKKGFQRMAQAFRQRRPVRVGVDSMYAKRAERGMTRASASAPDDLLKRLLTVHRNAYLNRSLSVE